jgi:hypothetical protein
VLFVPSQLLMIHSIRVNIGDAPSDNDCGSEIEADHPTSKFHRTHAYLVLG